MGAIAKILNQFFQQLSTIDGAQFLFLIDADRAHLSEMPVNDGKDLKALKRAAEANQAIAIDTTKSFRQFVADSGRSLEVGPYDHHWNAAAVQIVADLIAKRLPHSEARNESR